MSERRRVLGGGRPSDRYTVLGAGAAALGLTAVLYTQLTPFDGILGFVVIAYTLFLLFYALLVSFEERGPAVRDRIASAVVHSIGFLLLLVLGFIIGFILYRGFPALRHLNFYSSDMGRAGPLSPLTEGGVYHAVIGSLEQISLALLGTVPLGIGCALFLSETRGRFTRIVRTVTEAMTALPSIVAGLFVYAMVILGLGVNKSGFAASLALSVMMLPIIIRASDVVLRLVPGTLREASLALGASRWRTVWHVVLPTARSGLATSVILGTARGIGETSPVLLTAGMSFAVNYDPLSGPQVSLPLQTFSMVKSPMRDMVTRGFGTAAVLLVLVLILFVVARIVGGRPAGHLTAGQRRRRTRASARDLLRFDERRRRSLDIEREDGHV
ncbi:phosphate ABC transporter permease PstA [Longispora fulva]|uniref:Phosphate transport system permease protein PstA n=1 Tax=Longispora fulva TaxID=619741 RepID=A0A8J7KGJ1_9ACTN|nr:phosphate ABC transporter permease PstA [Longispora fulva]MBG6137430.1 phosphate transport system permease protein [Longispora fulva]